jgi:hypothetical protein
MSSTEIIILQRCKTGLVQFLDELINWMPDDGELITTRILVQDTLPIEELMKKLVIHMKPHEAKIKARDADFFMTDPNVFGNVKDQHKSQIVSLKQLWSNPGFTSSDREKVWKWMDFFVKCTNLYQEHRTE